MRNYRFVVSILSCAACITLCLAASPEMQAAGTSASATAASAPSAANWPQAVIDWKKPVVSPNYAKVTAHEPRFGDKALWPNIAGKEAYVSQQWPKGRVLVWAFPGETGWGGKKAGDHDPTDGACWLLDGKPLEGKLTLDQNTDVVFPDADKAYTVQMGALRENQVYRHITIGRNAAMIGGGDGVGRKIYGNVWIKQSGSTHNQGSTSLIGPAHTFFRNDNFEDVAKGKGLMCTQYFTIHRDGASVEFLGHVTMLDEFRISGGAICIVGPDSKLQPGRNAGPTIEKGGTLAIMDGGAFGSWANNFGGADLTCSGAIQGGLADRPLQRNAYLLLHFKNHQKLGFTPPGDGTRGAITARRSPSLLMRPGASLKGITADPAKARLVLSFMGEIGIWNMTPQAADAATAKPKDDVDAARWKWAATLPRGVDCWFAGGTPVENVEFDYFHKGGLMLESVGDRANWKGVTFGPHNLAQTDELFAEAPKLDRGGAY